MQHVYLLSNVMLTIIEVWRLIGAIRGQFRVMRGHMIQNNKMCVTYDILRCSAFFSGHQRSMKVIKGQSRAMRGHMVLNSKMFATYDNLRCLAFFIYIVHIANCFFWGHQRSMKASLRSVIWPLTCLDIFSSLHNLSSKKPSKVLVQGQKKCFFSPRIFSCGVVLIVQKMPARLYISITLKTSKVSCFDM